MVPPRSKEQTAGCAEPCYHSRSRVDVSFYLHTRDREWNREWTCLALRFAFLLCHSPRKLSPFRPPLQLSPWTRGNCTTFCLHSRSRVFKLFPPFCQCETHLTVPARWIGVLVQLLVVGGGARWLGASEGPRMETPVESLEHGREGHERAGNVRSARQRQRWRC